MADSTVNVYIIGHDKMSGAIGKANTGLAKFSNGLQSIGTNLSKWVTLPVLGGFALALKEANEAVKVAKQTEAVIKSTGGAAGVTAKEIDKLASALSRKAGIDDEVIQSGANLLMTFTDIKNEAC